MPDLQYLTTATADEPHLQFSWYLNTSHSFVLWPSLLPSPSAQRPTSRLTPGVPSLWSVILYPYGLQTITLEANSPLFPSSAVLNLILNKKRFRFLNEKKMSWTLSYVFFFFFLPLYHLMLSIRWLSVGLEWMGKFYCCPISQSIGPFRLLCVLLKLRIDQNMKEIHKCSGGAVFF